MQHIDETLHAPAIWGGLECTINRVGNRYLDQFEIGGFYNRPQDLDAVMGCGIQAIRFPVLWEKHQPSVCTVPNFDWAEMNLNKLRDQQINPIVGLLHHGSGPAFTNLLDDQFGVKLAEYASLVATRFPWITDYTPVNEPLTTARFSGLYGFWYPHKTNDVSFVKMLLNQLKGVVLSMQAIRKINPAARLMQTEDLGKTYSKPTLAYQANFENQRRWLSFDILTGRFNTNHVLWPYFMRLGIDETSLQFFLDNPCIPDIIGVNYYLTSERYLDINLNRHPPDTHGGNGLHKYADVEAVRMRLKEPHGAAVLFREICQRYKLPVAITEAHLNCTREEQLRWFQHIYNTAMELNNEGFNIRAVTAWSMLGAFGWNKLLTGDSFDYEPGVFDISAGYARPTALAHFLQSFTSKNFRAAQLCKQPGWWERPSRYIAAPKNDGVLECLEQPLVILGSNGKLGAELVRHCEQRQIPYIAPAKQAVNICSSQSIESMIKQHKPWAIINAVGYVDVDAAEKDKESCYQLNSVGAEKLAILCEQYKIKLVSYSSDLVFDGSKGRPYTEEDETNTLSIYGKSKVHAEVFLKNVNPSSLVIRTSAFFSPRGKGDFVSHILYHLSRGLEATAASDQLVSPTYVPHLAEASLNLLIDDASGIWHLANKGEITWYALACMAATYAGYDSSLIRPVTKEAIHSVKPGYSVLSSVKYGLMPSLDEALKEYFSQQLVII